MAKDNRSSNKNDLQIGQCIKTARLDKDMTQGALGDALGVSFQQIQKYERGINRVSARDIARIAKALDKPIEYFVGGVDTKRSVKADQRASFLATPTGHQIVNEAMKLPEELQRALIALARSLA